MACLVAFARARESPLVFAAATVPAPAVPALAVNIGLIIPSSDVCISVRSGATRRPCFRLLAIYFQSMIVGLRLFRLDFACGRSITGNGFLNCCVWWFSLFQYCWACRMYYPVHSLFALLRDLLRVTGPLNSRSRNLALLFRVFGLVLPVVIDCF